MLKIIQPHEIQLGMYVQGFNGNWLSHPFWRARFRVSSLDQLNRLRDGGVNITIDTLKGVDIAARSRPRNGRDNDSLQGSRSSFSNISTIKPRPIKVAINSPVPRHTFGKADKARALALAERSAKVVKAIFDDCRLGRSVSTTAIFSVVDDIATLLEQNAFALINVTRLKAKDDDTYTHSVAVCALMINLARETEASDIDLRSMGTAGILHDIGKTLIDESILKKRDALTPVEIKEIRQHPELGYNVLCQIVDLPPVCLDVCLHHHERLDGSGYPFGLIGADISQGVRIASICDVYDALTSDRPYRPGMTPVEALYHMENIDTGFDPDLLFRFMRSIGVFPANKLIRLRSNRLAIALPVLGQDCCPRARVFYSTADTAFTDYQEIVLGDGPSSDYAVSAEDPSKWFSGDWASMLANITAKKPIRSVGD